ncbi:MAG: hypothetical protein D6736_19495 [Nitrospinota bacterium]|nr:MAG: hypothetical protein D6736_19495 [Nitrospinota bacterium]
MLDLLKKMVYLGLGAAAITEEKLRQTLDEMIVQGKLGEKEGEELLQEFLQALSENQQKLQTLIEDRIRHFLQDLPLVTKEELQRLERRLESLERRLEQVEREPQA